MSQQGEKTSMAPVPVSVPAFTVLFSVAGMAFLSDGWELLDKTNPFLPKLVFINFFYINRKQNRTLTKCHLLERNSLSLFKNSIKNCF